MTSILHVWDQAGVSCILAKYQRKLGMNSLVIKRAKFDGFEIMKFYNEKTYDTFLGRQFLGIAINEAKNFEIVHVHDLFELIPKLRKKYPKKKLVLHYHGSKLRNTPISKRRIAEQLADIILVSTPDLLSFVDGIYLPNPVDIDHFSPRNNARNNLALGFIISNESEKLFQGILNEHGIRVSLKSVHRSNDPILYKDMPRFLVNHEYFLDVKWIYENKPGPFLSMTGLQALSLGMKVINFEYKIIHSLPEFHFPNKVVNKLNDIYNSV